MHHDRPHHHRRPHHHAARAVARDAVAQGPCFRRHPQFSGARCRDQRRHHRHGLSVPVPPGHQVDRRLPGGGHHPARHRQGRQRGRGDLAGSVEDHRHLRPRRHRHHGAIGARHRAMGRARQSRQAAAAPAVGALPRRAAGLWLGLLPRLGRRRHDRQGAALQGAWLQGDQDAGRAHREPRHRSRQCAAHARGARVRTSPS